MAKKKTYKTKSKAKEVNEPVAAYGKEKRLVFFKSFEEENAHTYKERALMSPLENFKSVTLMVEWFFQQKLKENPTLGNRIYFDNDKI